MSTRNALSTVGPPLRRPLPNQHDTSGPPVASSRKSGLGFQKEKPRRSGAKNNIAEGGSLDFRSEKNSERGDWFHGGRLLAVIPGKGGNGLSVPVLLLREGAPHTTQPMGHPRESMLKIKR
jgi:hypothetical protein